MATLKERLEAVLLAIGLDMKSKANSSVLANVATSGSYLDLTNKPILNGSALATSTEVNSTYYKDVTIVGASVDDLVFINRRARVHVYLSLYFIDGAVIAPNTVRLYFFKIYVNWEPGSTDASADLGLSHASIVDNYPWTINFSVIKK